MVADKRPMVVDPGEGRPLVVAILAGGLGTRLRPITEKVPKPLVEVAGAPFLHWQLLDLKAQGYTKIILLVAYLGEMIRAHFGDGSRLGLEIEYVFEPKPLGTGGAIKNAVARLPESFFLLNGDSFLRAPLASIQRSFSPQHCDVLIATYNNRVATPVPNNIKLGIMPNEAGGSSGGGRPITAYKKGAGLEAGFTHVDAGIYLLKRELFASYPAARFAIEDLWPQLMAGGRLQAFPVDERFYDIGTPERLKEFEEKVRDYFPHPVSH